MYDESQPEPLTEQDSPNHTKIFNGDANTDRRLDDSEFKQDWYKRLSSYNADQRTGHGSNEPLRYEQDNLAIYDAVVGFLECTPYQKRRGRQLFTEISVEELSSPGGIDAALVAFCVAAHVAREDGRMYHPNRNEERNDELFSAFIDDEGYRPRTVRKCYEKVGHRLPEYGDVTEVK